MQKYRRTILTPYQYFLRVFVEIKQNKKQTDRTLLSAMRLSNKAIRCSNGPFGMMIDDEWWCVMRWTRPQRMQWDGQTIE